MEKKGEWHLVKKNYYQKQIKTIYRSKRNQPQFVKTGVKGATTLLGSASMLLSSAPVVLGAEEAGGTEGTEAVIEQTQLTNQTKETVETTPIEQPTIPEDLTESTDSVTPTEPTESVDPIEPEEPVKPIEPTDPVEPTEPTEQVKPTEPTKPVEPTEPKAPVAPINPSTDEQSKEVTAPVQTEPVPVEQPIVSQVETQPITELVPATTEASDGALHFEKDESVESFIKKIGEPARKIGQKEDLYASVMIAQAILESASGTSQLAQAPNYNLFGIKGSHNGKSASFSTQEDTGNGSMITIQAEFRAYENYEESFEDYAKLMKEGLSGSSDYYSGTWKSNTETYEDATKFLTGRYATDTSYNQKLNGLIETYNLTEYDKEKAEAEISAQGYAVPVENYTISSSFGIRGSEFHRGLDMAAVQGEPIYASKAGTVKVAEFHSSWGNYVVVEHDDGMTTLYAHQSQYVVKPGDQVEQGQIIGYVGSTGNSTGSHLHFELCQDASLSQSQLIDPASVLF
ncbi:glucosaminidase domain-containing protein [Enterococcus avium]|uniref:Peptidoglycan DD-metalloendopeptidase family protein n=2 Tax=Enterococcus avium TaxID=33945 RepID=A0ABD5FDS7_ENTAV|nr:glucosaminidase domain-containing protein [Enterococcus avium]MDT2397145.1 peptidoglycan DD-metalloendopeptidase family protein [Enterococcus avium]MDT2437581.1 peptidoglycan DD-metalloendopeptidase family protein [Enterococcus avium]MDT2449230.1 peptidoglycan DD-metalloendopeptidase family protein [Enterococcus avium]MDT2467876.1 peptidoglycan DD-metalloendopeptidase family protein [Enterococcus avium]MDT2469828.1 peptidoglycan DD-metalloendopeptidase family protein [Enterococcus avium]